MKMIHERMAGTHEEKIAKYISTATFALGNAGRTLNRLCNHFRHKLPVQKNGDIAVFRFTEGNAELRADGGTLFCTCSSDEKAHLREIEHTLERHISGMAGVAIDAGSWRCKK